MNVEATIERPDNGGAQGTHVIRSSDLLGRVLVACEYSGKVRNAFARLGWDAWSCDIIPSESPGNHIQGDVTELLQQKWDIVIAHPPCTYLTVTANKWMKPEYRHRFPNRPQQREEAVKFFMACVNANAPCVAVENPIGIMSTRYQKPTQIIQPWQHGHAETKATCLWLKGLPKLIPTKIVEPVFWRANGKKYSPTHYNSKASLRSRNRLDYLPPGDGRSKLRSETYEGIAEAMANQWTIATRPNDRTEARLTRDSQQPETL